MVYYSSYLTHGYTITSNNNNEIKKRALVTASDQDLKSDKLSSKTYKKKRKETAPDFSAQYVLFFYPVMSLWIDDVSWMSTKVCVIWSKAPALTE